MRQQPSTLPRCAIVLNLASAPFAPLHIITSTPRPALTSLHVHFQVQAALAEQPVAWATWLEALLDVNLLRGHDSAAARAICVARMAHVLGEQHVELLLELERLCLGTREKLLEHLATQTAVKASPSSPRSSASDAASGDAAEWIKWWKRARARGAIPPVMATAPDEVLWKHYPPQPVPPGAHQRRAVRTTAAPRPISFDLSLCENSDGLSLVGEAGQTI